MLTGSQYDRINQLAEEVASREGCRVYDIDFASAGSHRTLRVFIDRLEGQVSIQDCSNVSNGLNLMLDVEDIVPGGAYHLEVSSPGLERPLRKAWHYEGAIGKKVRFRTKHFLGDLGIAAPAFRSLKQAVGIVVAVDGEAVDLSLDNETYRLPLSEIEKAKLVFEIEKGSKKSLKR